MSVLGAVLGKSAKHRPYVGVHFPIPMFGGYCPDGQHSLEADEDTLVLWAFTPRLDATGPHNPTTQARYYESAFSTDPQRNAENGHQTHRPTNPHKLTLAHP
jgi:hypothetical protein